MTTNLILGTAGHIDHGKTTLVKMLTGVDTDRLPEEKKRGITIELGFAELDLGDFRLGIVDVPGHEKFVRQMLAGAASIDLALLIVAADDSVKPQTREHLEVLRLLDLSHGVIALTKCDLPDPDWIDLVEEEVRELVDGTFLADAPIVRTSATTGSGLEELKVALKTAAQATAAQLDSGRCTAPFRMAIDRSFTVTGHGTVVTGSVSSGTCRVGDTMRVEPGHVSVRVRGLQNHDRAVDSVEAGQRAAINLAGIRHDEVRRGHELGSEGFLAPSQLLSVQLSLLPDAARSLKSRSKIRVHVGAAEVLASVMLLQQRELAPGESATAQLFLIEPVVTAWHQPFVIRSESPVETIGGGHVLMPVADKLKRADQRQLAMLDALQSEDPLDRAAAAVYFAGGSDWKPIDLALSAGVEDPDAIVEQLQARGDLETLKLSAQRHLIWHRDTVEETCDVIASSLAKLHARNPLGSMVQRSKLASSVSYCLDQAMLDYLLRRMKKKGAIRLTDRSVGLAGHGPSLSASETQLLSQLIDQFEQAGFQPPTIKECEKAAAKNKKSVDSLIRLAATDGDLVEISSEYYLHHRVEADLRKQLTDALQSQGGMTLSQIRELLQTTRKYAVPICEYLDRSGFTTRDGDLRRLNLAGGPASPDDPANEDPVNANQDQVNAKQS